MKVKDRISGQLFNAVYAANRLGNMRMWVDGRFYTDNEFDKKFIQVK